MLQDQNSGSGSGRRLLLAAGVSLLILFVFQLLILEPPAPPEEEEESAETEEPAEGEEAATDKQPAAATGDAATGDAATGDAATAAPAPVAKPEFVTLETDAWTLELTNIGGRATSYKLKLPERLSDRPNFLEPLLDGDELADYLPLDTTLSDLNLDGDTGFEIVEATDERVVMRWTSPTGVIVEKRFVPGDSDYAVRLELAINNKTGAPITDDLEFRLYNKMSEDEEPGIFSVGRPVSAACYIDEDVERADLGDEEESFKGSPKWVTVDEPYFAFVARPESGADSCIVDGTSHDVITATLISEVDIDPNTEEVFQYELYLGPKEYAMLSDYGHSIEKSIDYGFFEILSRPIAWLLRLLEGFVGNWGLAIMLLTIMIRGVLWPVTQKSQESMMRMKDVSPQMKELQEKYKNDPTLLQRKQMELFREHKVSPFGCLPIFLQIPIWFALYRTIYATAELYHASFYGWISDLSSPDPYYILPVCAGGLFFIQQRLTPTTSTDVRQKVMMTVFPLVFVVVMLWLPSGLNLYILCSSVIGVAQAVYTRKKNDKRKQAELGGAGKKAEDIEADPQTARERRAAKRRETRDSSAS